MRRLCPLCLPLLTLVVILSPAIPPASASGLGATRASSALAGIDSWPLSAVNSQRTSRDNMEIPANLSTERFHAVDLRSQTWNDDTFIKAIALDLGEHADASVPQPASRLHSAIPIYPLKASVNRRYLVDQNNVPFLITGESSQAMIGALSEADADMFLAHREAAGVNSVWVHVLCGQSYSGCRSDGTTYDGIAPFTRPGDLSTPNPAYFTRVDHMLSLAASHNMTVFLSPIETINWLELLRTNGVTKAFNYGVYLGNRYKDVPNLVWIHGNDFQSWSDASDDALVQAVANGIKSVDPNHLQTVELDYPTSASLDDPSWSSSIGLDLAYSYFSTYDQVLREYNRTGFLPVYFHEGVYEYQDYMGGYEGPHQLRAQAYWTQLSGAAGNFYGNVYTFRLGPGWQSHLSDPGFIEFSYWKAFFNSRAWYALVPDQNHSVVTSGYGTYEPISAGIMGNTSNYVTTARTPDGMLVLSYIPTNTTGAVNVDMTKLSGWTNARWFDPTTNSYQAIAGSPFPNTGTRSFTPPSGAHSDGTHDWLLVLEAVGSTPTNTPTNAPTATQTPTKTPTPRPSNSPTFADVPLDYPYYDEIEALYRAGYTAGCATDPLRFCPDQVMNRAESSVFVERGIHGTAYVPPTSSSQVFADLALDSWAANWVNGLWEDKYTAGCGTNPLVYCPWQGHSRAEGTVFYLRMLNGVSYEPPQPTQQTFVDVPLDAWYAKWVRAAYDAGLIPACQTAPSFRFCPEDPLSRSMAAYMMVKAKGLIPTDRIEFSPSSEDFANPERGFMRWTELWPEGTDWPWGLSHPADPADTLVWLNIRLDNYRTRPLDAAALGRIGAAFDVAKGAGLKVVARFMYNAGSGGPWSPDPSTWAPDATLDQVLEHIGQLKPLFASHADILTVLQAGFVGHWGEWHSSKNNLTSPANQKAILDALAEALPADRMLQVRTPAIKQASFGGPLSESDAFSGSAASRVGQHNDCFLASDDDAGTYRSTPDSGSSAETIAYWKDFVAKEGRFTPVGGETCSENPPRSLCPTALNELEMLHWSFINNSYNQSVLESWVTGGCMSPIRLRLGYRLVLTEATVPQAVRPGGAFDLQFRLRNDGFAAMYNPRPVFAVLDGAGARYEFPLENVDPRRWGSGTTQSITARLQLPPSIPSGTYRLSLWLPDPAASLRNDPRFAVRFANTQVWDASSGLNVLTTNFAVTVEAPALLDPAP